MKKFSAKNYVRSDLMDWQPYSAGDSAWELARRFNTDVKNIIKLNANENPYGLSPTARKAIASQKWYNYYPGDSYKALKKSIAKYANTNEENLVITNGSDEMIDLLFKLIINPNDEIILCPPTFSMYALYVKLNRGKVISVPTKNDFSIDITAVKDAISEKTKAIIICTPNNPTGTPTSLYDIEDLLKTNILVVVDEAYFEFCNTTALPFLNTYKNLIVLRTFSKWAGLAGLRIGYAVMDPFFAEKVNTIKSPFNVNLAAEIAAIATLSDLSFAKNAIKKIITERKRLFKALNTLPGITVFPSSANFLFVQLKNQKYDLLKKTFEKDKCVIRFFNSPTSGKGIRITVGTPKQNTIMLNTLKRFLKGM